MSASTPSARIDPSEDKFYFGKLERTEAERFLSGNGVEVGTFLIRRSRTKDLPYTLTLRCDKEVVHYQINSHGECWYSIDNGPLFAGLKDMVEHYSAAADGLPVSLRSPFKKNKKGEMSERLDDPGRDNTAAHQAAVIGDTKKIPNNSQLLIKNHWGRNPLHEAVRAKKENSVAKILEFQSYADKLQNMPDYFGWLPIHLAAHLGLENIVMLLMKNMRSIHAKTSDDEDAQHIAARRGHEETSIKLGLAKLGLTSTDAVARRSFPWYHGYINRCAAEFILERYGDSDGLFLVRQSSSGSQLDCVLSLVHDGHYYHYQIIADPNNHKYCIDEGPQFVGLDAIVAHYSSISDGLARVLGRTATVGKMAEPFYGDKSNMSTNAQKYLGDGGDTSDSSNIKMIPEYQLDAKEKIGSGNFGDVRKGVWNKGGNTPIDVALKTLKELDQHPTATHEFMQEAYDMTSLNHNYVVSILGMSVGKKIGMCIVLELVPYGALETRLRSEAKKKGHHAQWVKDGLPILFARQVVEGMHFLETKRVCHRDLATRNILLKTHTHIKISDFGLSRTLRPEENYYTSTTGGKWPIKWYAPESVNYGKFTAKSDVFSFGVTLWEMYTAAQEPWGEMMMSEVLERLNAGDRLERPPLCDNKVYKIMLDCWKMEAAERPSFEMLIDIFQAKVPSALQKYIL